MITKRVAAATRQVAISWTRQELACVLILAFIVEKLFGGSLHHDRGSA